MARSLRSYLLPVQLPVSGGVVSGTILWALRNGTARPVQVRRVQLVAGFDGVAAATSAVYGVRRLTAAGVADPTGAALTAIEKRNALAASDIAFARQAAAGLTAGAAVQAAPMAVLSCSRALAATVRLDLSFYQPYGPATYDESSGMLVLAISEGLAIVLEAASVAGDQLNGYVEWDEM